MALGKYSRVDNRKSSNYCSTVTLVVFVALCLVGVWMMTSSSVVPLQNSNITILPDNNNDAANEKVQLSDTGNNDVSSNESKMDNSESVSSENEVKAKQFEDNLGNLPEDATKGDNNVNSNQEAENSSEVNPQVKKDEGESKADEGSQIDIGNKEDDKGESEKKSGQSDSEVLQTNESNAGGVDSEGVQKSDFHEKPGETTDGTTKNDIQTEEKPGETTDGTKNDIQTEEKPGETTDGTKNDIQIDEKPGETTDGTKNDIQIDEKPGETTDGTKNDIQIEEKAGETTDGIKNDIQIGEKVNDKKDSGEKNVDGLSKDQSSNEVFPSGAQSELTHGNTIQNGSFSTQEAQSNNQKEVQKSSEPEKPSGINWKVCNVTAGPDYIPCLDNLEAIRHLRTTKHYEHRERHCPGNPPTCLVSLPEGYQPSIVWPTSREKIWYHNVPHTMLAEVKGHQNWVKLSGEYLTFPGGGTQFKNGALHYIDFIQQSLPDVAWGKRSRVVLDVGCGVASFGGFLFDRDVLTMSLAPKDEHEAQVQFALERGIPAISAVMGTIRLPFPGRAFDVVHCARCRVPWHVEGGKLLLELNRLLRPGGFFVWSATPIYQKLPGDVEIWEAMKILTKAMCWELLSITKDRVNSVGIAVYQKPMTNECYEQRSEKEPPLCSESDDPNAAWNVLLQACMHKIPTVETERGSKWPELWPARLQKPPYWLLSSQVGVYGKPAPDDFTIDYEHWKRVVTKSYLHGLGINWSTVRNVMDMRATYGGFAAALREMKLWVLNVIPIDAPDTLPIIYERGLIGMYHDWCESHSTYPRSYDLLHADHLFSKIKTKCNFHAFVAEVDRILRPGGKLIVRDRVETITELESMIKSMHWEIRMTYAKDSEGLLCAQKTMWRPKEMETIIYGIA